MRSLKLSSSLKLATLASVLLAGSAIADLTYQIDPGHTEVRFSWSHAGVSIQSGEFNEAAGSVTLGDDPEKASLEVTINPNSVSTGIKKLDEELISADWFDAETYPEITFKSTSVAKTGDDTMDVTGDLTLHGVTKEVTFETEMTHQGPHPLGKSFDYYKGEWIAIKGTTEIDHQAFGVGKYSTGAITISIVSEMKSPE